MPEAVIVAAARTPIGRAHKGSLASIRPDDLGTQVVQAALAQVPALEPARLDDLMLGCAQPAGEQGYNLGRAVAIGLGFDSLPGTTVHRYCASSLQTTRMAFHAIKAGEGTAFVSAGVECVSRYGVGKSDGMENSKNPKYLAAQQRTAARAAEGTAWTNPRSLGELPDPYIAMGETAENVAALLGVSRQAQDEWGVLSQNRAEAAGERRPDRYDVLGALLCLAGVAVIMYAPRTG